MQKRVAAAVIAAGLVAGGPALAEDGRAQHYEAKPAPNLAMAVQNLRDYNRKLEQQLSQEMTPENMNRIHQLSYTLENALQRLDRDLENIANVLEGMHLASERMNASAVTGNGEVYLENMQLILGQD